MKIANYSSLNIESGVEHEEGQDGGPQEKRMVKKLWVMMVVLMVVVLSVLMANTTLFGSRAPVAVKTREEVQAESKLHGFDEEEKKLKERMEREDRKKWTSKNYDLHAPKKGEKVEYFEFSDMVHPLEHHEEIFGGFKELKADKDGFFSRNVHVSGADGGEMRVNYRGRYKSDTHFHNLENWEHMTKFGCTESGLVLEYKTEEEMHRAKGDLSDGLALKSNVLVTGKQLLRCPKSKEPDEILKAHDFGEDMKVQESRMTQSVRRVNSVRIVRKEDRSYLHLETNHANLLDVFEDLEFSGGTNMVERDSVGIGRKRHRHDEPNEDGVLHSERDAYEEEKKTRFYPTGKLTSPMMVDKKNSNRRLVWWSVVTNWVTKNIVDPIVDFVSGIFKDSVVKFIRSVSGTIIQPVLHFLGAFVPELLNVEGRFLVGKQLIALNYDASKGRASRILKIDSNGIQTGPYFSAGKTSYSLLVDGKVVCKNCFIRFYDGWFTWKVIIGGSNLGLLEMKMKTSVEMSLELDATVGLTTQATLAVDGIPIPGLSVPLGVVTLGFSLDPEITIGVKWTADGFYYRYYAIGWQEFGIRASIFGGVEALRDGSMKKIERGPLIKNSMTASVYLLPLVGLVFTDVMAIEAGLQPTMNFVLKPAQQSMCALDWAVEFDCPLVVGAWIGLKTPFGMWRLAGFSQSFSVLPTVTIATGCVTSQDMQAISQATGMPLTAAQVGATRVLNSGGGSKFNADVQNFQLAKKTVMATYPLEPTFPSTEETWVNGNGRDCATACGQDGGAQYSAYHGEANGFNVCAVKPLCTHFVNKEHLGTDMAGSPKSVTSAKECQVLCLDTPGCNCWSANYPNATQCHLRASCSSEITRAGRQSGRCTDNLGYRSGYDTGSGCMVAYDSSYLMERTGKEYTCLCVRNVSAYSLESVTVTGGDNCGRVCEVSRKEPVVTGGLGNTNIYYLCGARYPDASKWRAGFNLGGKTAVGFYTLGNACLIPGTSKTGVQHTFSCVCRTPKIALPRPLQWVSEESGSSCANTCDDLGQYPVSSGSRVVGLETENYLVCKRSSFSSGRLKQYLGYTGVRSGDGSYLPCTVSVSPGQNSTSECLCTRSLERYVTWYNVRSQSCLNFCTSKQMFPLYVDKSSTNYVCAALPNGDPPALAGNQIGNWCYVKRENNCSSRHTGVDIPGGDLPGIFPIVTSYQQCQQLCLKKSECKCWTAPYPMAARAACYMKSVCDNAIVKTGRQSGWCQKSDQFSDFRCPCSAVDMRLFQTWA